jgi:hypothetical protein
MKAYGFFGWQEFNGQRRIMLNRYFEAKAKTKNKKVKTEHGVATEAIFRDFLRSFLPKRFEVTSGYIIPDLLAVSPTYELPHFDVIIYDALESPVLWVEDHADKSGQGAARAIPAKYVRAILEVKATLTKANLVLAREKLLSVALLAKAKHLVLPMTTAMIFFELPERHERAQTILSALGPTPFMSTEGAGGLVLHCHYNPEAVGLFHVQIASEGMGAELINQERPICMDIDKIKVWAHDDYRRW